MTGQRNLWCVHGNVGQPEDFAPFARALSSRGPATLNLKFSFENLWEDTGLTPEDTPAGWGARFTKKVKEIENKTPQILIGYSLGGRLVMQALKAAPRLFSQVVLVSSHPGGLTDSEKEQRRLSDESWATRLLDSQFSWESFLRDWDAQPVFSGALAVPSELMEKRRELIPSRIAAAFQAWSLSRMTVSLHEAANLGVPILWVAGERDSTMRAHQERLRPHLPPCVVLRSVDCGHRVLHEAPEKLAEVVGEFLR
jgi:2-succinyl-6-hydroxy-2,4-cyclohexadiene-1-carboxylate synthase